MHLDCWSCELPFSCHSAWSLMRWWLHAPSFASLLYLGSAQSRRDRRKVRSQGLAPEYDLVVSLVSIISRFPGDRGLLDHLAFLQSLSLADAGNHLLYLSFKVFGEYTGGAGIGGTGGGVAGGRVVGAYYSRGVQSLCYFKEAAFVCAHHLRPPAVWSPYPLLRP